MSIQQDNIITLTGEDGKELSFEHIDTVLHEGKEYVLLQPVEPIEGIGEDEEGVVILRIIPGDEEDVYENVEDDTLLDTVFEKYLATMDEDGGDFDE